MIDVANETKKFADTHHFATREFGQDLLPLFEKIVNNADEKVITFDFQNVGFVDFSCPNEIFGHLITNLKGYGDKYIFVKNFNNNQLENFNIALSEKKIAILDITNKDQCTLLGHIANYLEELFHIVNREDNITARQIADMFDLKISTTSSKLLTLWKMGLVQRFEVINEEGKEFRYKSILELI